MNRSIYTIFVACFLSAFASWGNAALAANSILFYDYAFHNAQERDAVLRVLETWFGGTWLDQTDYLGVQLAREAPHLVASSHVFGLPPSVNDVAKMAAEGGAGVIFFDLEHWSRTPINEQSDPAASIRAAAAAAGKTSFGITPDGLFIGVSGNDCTASIENGIIPNVNYSNISAIIVQAQSLVSDVCVENKGAQAAADTYLAFVQEIRSMVKSQNQNTLIFAAISLRDSQPNNLLVPIQVLAAVVDGFYVSYPPPLQCPGCSPEGLSVVLQAIKQGSD